MSTVALNNLLTYILSLGLSTRNKKWLAEKILESNVPTKQEQEQMVKDSLTRAFGELKEAKSSGKRLQTGDELLEEMKQW